jgi:CheY-like chemotaxis protein
MSPDLGSNDLTLRLLIEGLKDPDGTSRVHAALALSSMASTDPVVVPALVGALQDSNVLARTTAALGLGLLGPQAGDAVPALIAALRDPSPVVRRQAARALVRIRLDSALAVPALWRAVWDTTKGSGPLAAPARKGMDPEGGGADLWSTNQSQPKPLSGTPAATARTSGRLRILVVEDNQDAADSLRMLLELCGHEVAVAYSGPSGVTMARERPPDVLLCDIGLPGLDGYGVAGELRRHPTTAAARLIAVTAYGTEEDRRKTREAGFERHLVKPVDPASLVSLLAVPSAL